MDKNPFIFGKPVRKEDFYNRREEIGKAVGFIKNLQSFSIIGERRIGKTSFMEYVLSEKVLEDHGIELQKHVVLCFSLSSIYGISKESLLSAIIEKTGEQELIETSSTNDFDKLKAYVEKLASQGRNLIIALDEFEVIAPILYDQLSHWLRFIFQNPNVMAITASQVTVRKLKTSGGVASPLFNVFGKIPLGLFTREETENMLTEVFHKGGMELNEEEISFLADLSGGNPYFIQLAGYHYYDERKKNREIIHEKFKDSLFYHSRDQFESYWEHLTKKEKEFLLHIKKSEDSQVSNILEEKGLIFLKNGKWEIFSPLFEEFIKIRSRTDRDLIFGD